MRVLVAPDKFRGTLTAAEAARAIADGWRRTRPGDEVEELPMADGGEGTLDALVASLKGERLTTLVTGPIGEPVVAAYGMAPTPQGNIGIVEMARASGLELVPEDRRDVLRSTTHGTGELILAACSHDPRRVIVCIGGSATSDGGAGMAQALGVRLLDEDGRDLGPGGAELSRLSRIDVGGLSPAVGGVRFEIASDVDNPLVGPEGAARVYGPQKGASPEDVEVLEAALRHYADVVARDVGVDVRDRPGAGAAGGLGAGLMAFLGAEVRPGIEVVMDAVGFAGRLKDVDLVVTGEGKLDEQSLHGKTPAGVMAAAEKAGVPVVIVAGRAEVLPDGVEVASLAESFGLDRAMREAEPALEELGADLAGRAEELAGQAR